MGGDADAAGKEKGARTKRTPSGTSSIIRCDFASKGDEGRTSLLITVKAGRRGGGACRCGDSTTAVTYLIWFY